MFTRLVLLALAATAAFTIGCSSVGGCRGDRDCTSGTVCVPPGVGPGCGIPCMAERSCASSADCSGDEVCIEYVATCCFAGELSSFCGPRCTDTSCAAGERCDATSGLCAPIPCDDGFACEPFTRCEAGALGADSNGCVRDACSGDGDCGGGTCVLGFCYESAGECMGPVP